MGWKGRQVNGEGRSNQLPQSSLFVEENVEKPKDKETTKPQ